MCRGFAALPPPPVLRGLRQNGIVDENAKEDAMYEMTDAKFQFLMRCKTLAKQAFADEPVPAHGGGFKNWGEVSFSLPEAEWAAWQQECGFYLAYCWPDDCDDSMVVVGFTEAGHENLLAVAESRQSRRDMEVNECVALAIRFGRRVAASEKVLDGLAAA
jgi:hypothetical protein